MDQAWTQVLNKIQKKKGQWPDQMIWAEKSNRHLLLTIVQKGLRHWRSNQIEEAKDLFRKLLHLNPTDELGARHFLLACLMGYTFEKFEAEFENEGYLDDKVDKWFLDQHKAFLAEFDWWIKGNYKESEEEDSDDY
jgi:hypothetical protein